MEVREPIRVFFKGLIDSIRSAFTSKPCNASNAVICCRAPVPEVEAPAVVEAPAAPVVATEPPAESSAPAENPPTSE